MSPLLRPGFRLAVAVVLVLGSLGRCQVSPARSRPFSLDSDEFPLGMFSTDGAGAMDQVAKMGITYVHTYGMGASNDAAAMARDIAFLDQAAKRGLKVIYNLRGDAWVKKKNGVAEMMKLVNAVKDHPGLGFWYLFDEPDGRCEPAELIPFYRALKKATPTIPVAVATAWSKNWQKYNDALDILMIDIYPVQHKPFPKSDLSAMTRFTDGALGLGKPVMPINQCINWKVFAGKKKTYRGSPVAELRFPTTAELRYWCYSGAAQGVRGMFWWSYARSVQAGYGWINQTFGPVMREFHQFTRLTAPTYKPIILKRARDGNFRMALWRRPAGTFLVLVNAWPLEQSMGRWLEGEIDHATLTPWGHTRNIDVAIENGRLTGGSAHPWEVFVWKVLDADKATK